MIKLANIINELGINRSMRSIPDGWSDTEDCSIFEPYEEGKIIEFYTAPMEGWDDNHHDSVSIIKTPHNEYIVNESWAYAGGDSHGPFKTFNEAFAQAVEIMEEIKSNWEDEDIDDDEDD